jgi:hypothetical protein
LARATRARQHSPRALVDGNFATSEERYRGEPCERVTPDAKVRHEKPAVSGGLCEADDGTRTHDLLHGKQTL